jgi:amphi-Trp domain-containing protein
MTGSDLDTQDEPDDDDLTLIREGRDFEQEYRLTAAEAGRFLVEVGEQLQEGDELTLTGDEWTLPFSFGEPVELEVDYEGYGERELEIELAIPGTTDENAPTVE